MNNNTSTAIKTLKLCYIILFCKLNNRALIQIYYLITKLFKINIIGYEILNKNAIQIPFYYYFLDTGHLKSISTCKYQKIFDNIYIKINSKI